MRYITWLRLVSIASLASFALVAATAAQEQATDLRKVKVRPVYRTTPMTMDPYAPQDQAGGAAAETKTETRSETKTEPETGVLSTAYGYREVSDFFNIREANPQVDKGEWEAEFIFNWSTRSNEPDELALDQSIKYGITDDAFVELEVLEPQLGEGGDQGTGELVFILYNRFVRETENLPAFGLQGEMRIPSGDGSSGVDGTLAAVATKTFAERFRVHFEGWIQTANGNLGSDDADRRHFQWALGPGFDYMINEKTLVLLNYRNRSSEVYGNHNQNVLELGGIYEIARSGDIHQHVKAAIDIGLDGSTETEHFGAKVMYSIDWK